jgi:hypothetical protein
MITRKTIAKTARVALSNGETIFVTFTKTDGTKTMRNITRNMMQIPKDKHPKFVRAENPAYITGFDLDKGDWIRFHQDNILTVSTSIDARNVVLA